jgi:predicted small metal-binding protein
VVRAQTEEELFKKAAEHGRKDHHMRELSEELKAKMRSLIREV